MITPAKRGRNHGLLDGGKLNHQFGEKSFTGFIEQQPQGSSPFFGCTILAVFGRSFGQ
jgi:hypothetical protein